MSIKTYVFDCARCGEDHGRLTFEELEVWMMPENCDLVWSHWCACPTNGQPIMLRQVTIDEAEED